MNATVNQVVLSPPGSSDSSRLAIMLQDSTVIPVLLCITTGWKSCQAGTDSNDCFFPLQPSIVVLTYEYSGFLAEGLCSKSVCRRIIGYLAIYSIIIWYPSWFSYFLDINLHITNLIFYYFFIYWVTLNDYEITILLQGEAKVLLSRHMTGTQSCLECPPGLTRPPYLGDGFPTVYRIKSMVIPPPFTII